MEQKAFLDVEAGLARIRGNRGLFGRMLGMFLNGAEFGEFEQALAAGDFSLAADKAHAIKGMTGNLGMNALFETSNALMTSLRQGPPDAAMLGAYRDALEQTRAAVKAYLAEANG